MDSDIVLCLLPRIKNMTDVLARQTPPGVSVDDLHGVAALELVEAVARFGPHRNRAPEKFEAYVRQRIRRALLAELRNAARWEDKDAAEPLMAEWRLEQQKKEVKPPTLPTSLISTERAYHQRTG